MIAVLADVHLDSRGPRAAECKRVMRWVARDIRSRAPELVLVAGDWFERGSTPEDRELTLELLHMMGAPVFFILGNHDHPDDLAFWGRLEYEFESPVVVQASSGTLVRPLGAGAVALHFLPWPRLTAAAARLEPAERLESSRQALRSVVSGFSIGQEPGMPSIVVGHLELTEATYGGQQLSRDALRLSASDLPQMPGRLYTLGHVHKAQAVRSDVVYAGCPWRQDWSEAANEPSYLMLEPKGDGWQITRIETPSWAMLTMHVSFDEGRLVCDLNPHDPEQFVDAEVRVRVSYDPDQRQLLEQQLPTLLSGLRSAAANVVVERIPVVHVTSRLPEIGRLPTVVDKLVAWATATGVELGPGVGAKLEQLEREVLG